MLPVTNQMTTPIIIHIIKHTLMKIVMHIFASFDALFHAYAYAAYCVCHYADYSVYDDLNY